MSDSYSRSRNEGSTEVHLSETVLQGRVSSANSASERDSQGISQRSVVIEQAVNEFFSLCATNPNLSPGEFCQRFADLGSSIQSSIGRQLELETFLKRSPWLELNAGTDWPSVGDRLGSFIVIEGLGRGGLGRVYLCREPDLGDRQVVLKLGRSSRLEAHTLGLLTHPNIVPILFSKWDATAGLEILGMPFLGRSTLTDLIDVAFEEGPPKSAHVLDRAACLWRVSSDRVAELARVPLPDPGRSYVECVVEIGVCLAEALEHAHRNGIFHGDIKPSNVLLTESGSPLLMDFNLSGNTQLASKARGGTLPYMPPEQLRLLSGERGEYGAASDVFSLGVVLYELLTGRLPYMLGESGGNREDLVKTFLLQQERGFGPIGSFNSDVPVPLADAIHRCLSLDATARPQSAGELRQLLQPWTRSASLARRHRRLRNRQLTLAVVTLLSIVAGGVTFALLRPPEHVRQFARAVAYQKAGNLAEALPLFAQLAQQRDDPHAAEFVAYCFSRQGRLVAAIPWYQRAHELGADGADLHNNWSVALELGSDTNSDAVRLALAHQHIKEAYSKEPTNPVIQLNWVLRKVAISRTTKEPLSDAVLEVCAQLARKYPKNGVVNQTAAEAFSRSASVDPANVEFGAQCLLAAMSVERGPSHETLEHDDRWAGLRSSPLFTKAASTAQSPSAGVKSTPHLPRLLVPRS
jgi:eukaryotic-like serine/threonine-protein kinase